LGREQAHYLVNVLRLGAGDTVEVFNGRDGAWRAYLTDVSKKTVALRCERRTADVGLPPDIDFLFAPLKHARLDYLVEKATELGVRRLRPVLTARTNAARVNVDRMRANAIEAAEQCNLVFVPEVMEPASLVAALAGLEPNRTLVFCDETAKHDNPLHLLKQVSLPVALLVGPEGGFTDEERRLVHTHAPVTAISLGPRILRADTAAVAALTVIQAALGDWQ
jgi:16S rRNA (uracil1498-N3)-methyltransferase